jgi:hypothetical protein
MGRKKLYTPATFGGPPTPTERCPVTHKVRFETKELAQATCDEWASQNDWAARIYGCHYCKGFHITRNTKKAQAARS